VGGGRQQRDGEEGGGGAGGGAGGGLAPTVAVAPRVELEFGALADSSPVTIEESGAAVGVVVGGGEVRRRWRHVSRGWAVGGAGGAGRWRTTRTEDDKGGGAGG
jgi:hypothetical protein